MDKVFDRVKVASATTGTSSLTLGAADTGYLTFAQAGAANGDTVAYVIEDGAAFEIGYGVYNSAGPTLTRNVIASSNANALIVLTGNQRIFSAVQKRLFDGKLSLDGGVMTATIQSTASLLLEATGGAAKTIRASGTGSQLVLEQTGGQYGGTRLTILNETGANGATFENMGLNLVDFGFKTAAGQRNIRYEARPGFQLGGNSTWEFQFGGSAAESAFFMIGDTKVYSTKPIYVGANVVWNAGNFDPATKAALVHSHTEILTNDTRTADDTPNTFATWKGLRLDFKNTAIGGLTGFHGALTVAPWSDDSGGYVYQLSFAGDGTPDLYLRSGARAGAWGSQYKLWHQNNFDPTTKVSTANFTFANLGGKPTTLGGYGITDALLSANFTFANLGGKPTTLGGYGITDAVPAAQLGAVNGVATLDGTGAVPVAQLTVKGFTIGVSGKSANAARYPTTAPYAFTATTAACSAVALVAATALTVYTLKKGTVAAPTTIGTFTFAAGATIATVSITAGAIAAADQVWLEGPATADATLADIAFLIRG